MAMAVQLFSNPSETEHLEEDYFLPVQGFMLVPFVEVPHGPTLSNLYMHGVNERRSCAVASAIEAVTAAPMDTGCDRCMDIAHLAGLMSRIANRHPDMINTMKFSLFTILKHAIVRELGLPEELARQDDYDKDVPLPANAALWAQNNLHPEMLKQLLGGGLL